MEIHQQILTENDCYKSGRYITPSGIMVHSTGANNPNLRRYLPGDDNIGYNSGGNHWNMSGLNACVHGFIGRNSLGGVQIYQTLPWDMRGWHAGGTANNTHLSFEICEDGLEDANYFSAVYEAAAELCAYLCRLYAIMPEAVICHSEGCAMGIASNHADVMHWFPRFGKTMDDFRQAVQNRLEEGAMADINEAPQWAVDEGVVAWAIENGIIRGDEGGNMRWSEPITRIEAAALLFRLSKSAGQA